MLAAGQSRRMGQNKLLLTLAGESLVRRACGQALLAGLEPLIVVLGHEAARVERELAALACLCVRAARVDGAMSESLHCGLDRLPQDAACVVVMLADMVQVTEPMLRALVEAAQESDAPIVCSRYGATPAPPVLFRRALFPELLAASGEGCGRAVIERHRDEIRWMDWPITALADVDTPEDFARLRS
jgi:molybdenum cofactor cytidylyltransferase